MPTFTAPAHYDHVHVDIAPRPTTLEVNWEHQPREREVPCAGCRGTTTNDHAVCNWCLDKGKPVTCHAVCADVARSAAARAVTA